MLVITDEKDKQSPMLSEWKFYFRYSFLTEMEEVHRCGCPHRIIKSTTKSGITMKNMKSNDK